MSRAAAARSRAPQTAPERKDPAPLHGRIAFLATAAALLAACLVVDPRAEAAFDAPKRLLVLLAVGVAIVALLLAPPRARRPGAARPRAVLVLAGVGLLGIAVAALGSGRVGVALDALRSWLLFLLLLPLGASRAAEGARGRWLLKLFVGAAALNALLALLERAGWIRLFDIQRDAGRGDAAALVGNPGLLGLLLALAVVAAAAVLASAGSTTARRAWGAAMLVLVAGLVATRGLTALITVGVGLGVLGALVLGRRLLKPALIAAVLAAGALLVPPLDGRVRETVAAVRAGEWDRMLTYRLGAWAAALEMIRERPLLGFGPGTFGAEFVPHRVGADMRWRTRLVTPSLASSYSEAHCDYLQLAAEVGIPATLAVVGAAAALVAGLVRGSGGSDPRRREAALLAALLCAGAAAGLTWFPLQRTCTAVPLLLAAGRGFRWLDSGEAAR